MPVMVIMRRNALIYLFICLASRCSQALEMGSGPMLSLQQLSSNNVIFSSSCDNV